MSKKYGLFREDIAEYMTAVNAEMKDIANRSYYTNQGIAQGKDEGIAIGIEQGKDEGIAIGIEQGIHKGKRDTLIHQMKKIYPSQDISWLDDCHLDQLDYALDIILDGYSFDEFKQKVLDYQE